jgi:hypothetical protein
MGDPPAWGLGEVLRNPHRNNLIISLNGHKSLEFGNNTQRGSLCSVLLTKYHSGDQIKKTKMGMACSTYGERIGTYRILVGKPEGRRPLGIPRRRWEGNIKIDLQEVR